MIDAIAHTLDTNGMENSHTWTAIGLMSGTSMDGIDAALIRTDGRDNIEVERFRSAPYDAGFRDRLRSILGGKGQVDEVERDLTDLHVAAVQDLLVEADLPASEVDLVGFHGHTILHQPELGRTWQIGDGVRLARALGIDVVADLRSADVAAGGQGAPLASAYHRALVGGLDLPLAVLNVGGVANVTWIGSTSDIGEAEILAFDTGPGNALLDDWVAAEAGIPFDRGGEIGRSGKVERGRLATLLAHPYFERPAPKSLDRDDFIESARTALMGLSIADGAALLTAFTVETVARAANQFPTPAKRWIVCGGGRKNSAIMDGFAQALGVDVVDCDTLGWDGDALEAQAFAYLAVRSRLGLTVSFPGTTGTPRAITGGVLFPKA